MGESCESCKYWLRDPGAEGQPDTCGEFVGKCRRTPPVSVLDGEGAVFGPDGSFESRACHSFVYWSQPATINTEWCGEYSP